MTEYKKTPKGKLLYEGMATTARVHGFTWRKETWEELNDREQAFFTASALNHEQKIFNRIRETFEEWHSE
jgi:hypothetical protein